MKTRLFILPIIMLFLCMNGAYALNIKGTVKDKGTGKAMEGVSIMLRNASGVPIAYCYSGKDGSFSISTDKADDNLVFEARMLGYSMFRMSSPLPEHIDISMEENKTQLNEVVVTAKQVEQKGDTIKYHIPTLVSNEDRNLADVLQKLPGISVDKSGYVRAYGKPINKLYIEGVDLLEHRYNIATKNLDPRDIKEVDVYENHQPIRALAGVVESDQAALNILLKDSAKAKWLGTLQAEAGGSTEAPWVPYSASGMLMNISTKFQTMNTLKTDAAGHSITSVLNNTELATDFNNFDFRDRYFPATYTGISHKNAPIDNQRTRFNTTYSASTNNKFSVGRKKLVTIGVSGLYEDEVLDSDNSITRTYDLGDGKTTSFTEKNDAHSRAYTGYGNINATVNTDKLYLRDNFQFEVSGSKVANRLGGTSTRAEDSDLGGQNILNYLKFIKRFKKNSVGLDIFTQYSKQTEDLLISSPDEQQSAVQRIDGRYFFNTIKYNYSYSHGEWLKISSTTSLDYLNRHFSSDLSGVRIEDNMKNDVKLQYLRPYEMLFATFTVKRFKAFVGIDLWYQYLDYRLESEGSDNKFAFSPYIGLEYKFGPRLRIMADAAYIITPIDEKQIYTGLVMNNYKYLTRGRTDLEQLPGYLTDMTIDFKDPISGWFLKGNATWSSGKSFEMTRFFIGDDYIVNVQSNDISRYSMLSASAEISKAFMDIAGKLTGSFGFSRYSSSILQNDILIDYDGDAYTAGLKYNGGITRWMSLQYSGKYSYSTYLTDGRHNNDDTHSMYHSLTLSFFPVKSLEIDLSGEYYFNKFTSEPTHNFFLDLSAWYFVNSKLQFFIHARNMMDERQYTYSYISPLETIHCSYHIRPFNILVGAQIKF